ncbi:hypothetical protein [Nostoc sp. NIES-3756]|uniref:hypothetical protein n=1 Tax=Nostoc sp. NIES-3756 TaxID=1751286 RepID=UPI004040ACE6
MALLITNYVACFATQRYREPVGYYELRINVTPVQYNKIKAAGLQPLTILQS